MQVRPSPFWSVPRTVVKPRASSPLFFGGTQHPLSQERKKKFLMFLSFFIIGKLTSFMYHLCSVLCASWSFCWCWGRMCKFRTFNKASNVGVTYSIDRYPILMWTLKNIYIKPGVGVKGSWAVSMQVMCRSYLSVQDHLKRGRRRREMTSPSTWPTILQDRSAVDLNNDLWSYICPSGRGLFLACHWHEVFRLKCSFWQWSCPYHHCSLLWVSATAAHMVSCTNDCACTCWDMFKILYYTQKRLGPRPYLYSIVNNYLRVQNNAILFSKPDAHILEVAQSVTQSISLSQNEVL